MQEGKFRVAGEKLWNPLKSESIKQRKPYLKVCSNHKKLPPRPVRWWQSLKRGTAYRDGLGWFQAAPKAA